jgi:hypothetical protein
VSVQSNNMIAFIIFFLFFFFWGGVVSINIGCFSVGLALPHPSHRNPPLLSWLGIKGFVVVVVVLGGGGSAVFTEFFKK